MLKFISNNHSYQSTEPDNIKWVSVSTLVHHFKEPFDAIETAKKCSVCKPGRYPNKWFTLSPEEIMNAWDKENKRSTDLGTWYHKQREFETGNVHRCQEEKGVKYSSDQHLAHGVHVEPILYLESAGIAGQSDKIIVDSPIVTIRDFKTNKEIKREGFKNWEGVTKKLLAPLQHLDDCELNLYALQLSTYLYIILRHNPKLLVGKLIIEHVKFETNGIDNYGYPITKLNAEGEPIVKEIEEIELPYLKNEVVKMIEYLKLNRDKITK